MKTSLFKKKEITKKEASHIIGSVKNPESQKTSMTTIDFIEPWGVIYDYMSDDDPVAS